MKDIIAIYNKKRSFFSNSVSDSSVCSKIAIIIPACNEYPGIFDTLNSIKKSIELFKGDNISDVKSLFTIIIVVNNPSNASELVKKNNYELVHALKAFSFVKIKIIDICSFAIPVKKQGVGYARRYGMDWAVFYGAEILACMDADTLVSENYATDLYKCAINSYEFAVCQFEHQKVKTHVNSITSKIEYDTIQYAIETYESYIKEHSKLLAQTGTPYWPYSLGPTIVCSSRAYAAVGGMPVRKAGEDFYFVQALIKYEIQTNSSIVKILDCTVYPGARLSKRVPFGTGPVLVAYQNGGKIPAVYSKTTYQCVSELISIVHNTIFNTKNKNIETILKRLPPNVVQFLINEDFVNLWEKLKSENKSCPKKLETAFHVWFDGLKIIKLIHFIENN